MTRESFATIEQSRVLSRKVLSETYFTENSQTRYSEGLVLGELERYKLDKMIDVLDHPALNQLIEEGKVTLGAIKPRTEDSKLSVDSDEVGERILLGMIKSPLEVVFTISLSPSPDDIEEFYPEEVRQRLSSIKTDDTNEWQLFKTHMLSGPITYFLLYAPDGNAVAEWRQQIGATNPEKASPDSIRGRFALSVRKNLVHGSSGDTKVEKINNVKLETEWLKKRLEALRSRNLNLVMPVSEATLREVNVLRQEEMLLALKRIMEFTQLGAETFLTAYSVVTQDESGNVKIQHVAQKAVVSMGNSELHARQMWNRLKLLQGLGIITPKIYGIKGADIFEEYIANAKSYEELVTIINSNSTPGSVRSYLMQRLTDIANILDSQGFQPVGKFWTNLLFDGKEIYFVDTGSDLGPPHPERPNTISINQLQEEFNLRP